MATPPRILIAGIGNIFFGDDAFGCDVVRRLTQRSWPQGVRIVDFGIRGIDLAYALMEGDDVTILIDAVQRGGKPGTLYLIEPDVSAADVSPDCPSPPFPTHNVDPAQVIRMVHVLGGHLERLLLVGCEPTPLDSENDLLDGLSPPVADAVDHAVELVVSLTERILAGQPIGDHPLSLQSPAEKEI